LGSTPTGLTDQLNLANWQSIEGGDNANEDDLIDFLKPIMRLPEYLGDKFAIFDVKLHT